MNYSILYINYHLFEPLLANIPILLRIQKIIARPFFPRILSTFTTTKTTLSAILGISITIVTNIVTRIIILTTTKIMHEHYTITDLPPTIQSFVYILAVLKRLAKIILAISINTKGKLH